LCFFKPRQIILIWLSVSWLPRICYFISCFSQPCLRREKVERVALKTLMQWWLYF
jgi:hypothetical protein